MGTNDYSTVATLFRHNLWANLTLFELCAKLSEAQLDTKIVGTYGSIRETLQHITTSERSYITRIVTGKPYRHTQGQMTVSEMIEMLRGNGDLYINNAPKVQANDQVEVDWEGTPRMLPCSVLLTQAINHATEHRAQIMTTLTQIGIQPPDLDGWSFFDVSEPM